MNAASGGARDLDATEMIDVDALASRSVRSTSKKDETKKSHKKPVAFQGASASLPGEVLEVTAEGVPEPNQGHDSVEAGMNVRDVPKLVNDVPNQKLGTINQ